MYRIIMIVGFAFLGAAFMVKDWASILTCVLVGLILLVFGYSLRPDDNSRGGSASQYDKYPSHARITGGYTIEITNLSDRDAKEMQKWHVSSLEVRERDGYLGTWTYHFAYMGGGRVENSNDPLHKEAMRYTEQSLNDFIETHVNRQKGGKA